MNSEIGHERGDNGAGHKVGDGGVCDLVGVDGSRVKDWRMEP